MKRPARLALFALVIFALGSLVACGGGGQPDPSQETDGDTAEATSQDGDNDVEANEVGEKDTIDGDVESNEVGERDTVDGDTIENTEVADGDETEAEAYDPTQPGEIWQDPITGWRWQKGWTGFGDLTSTERATQYCKQLRPGNWNLPTLDQLRTLIQGCPTNAFGGSCIPTQPDTCWPNTQHDAAWEQCNTNNQTKCFPAEIMESWGSTNFLSATVQAAETTGGNTTYYYLSENGCTIITLISDDDAHIRCVDTITAPVAK